MKHLITLFACIAISMQTHAQFQYSVKAGCSWPNITHMSGLLMKENVSFTFGANVDYTIKHLGIQSGLIYKQISEETDITEPCGLVINPNSNASFIEIPLLVTGRVSQHPKSCNLIVSAGPYAAIKVHQKVDMKYHNYGEYKSYYGIMATAQLEFVSHYFIRGEYQWALESDRKGFDERRTNIFSLVAGYKF